MITINNNLERSSYLMNGPITVLIHGKITGRNFLNTTKRWELIQAVQKVKSFFWQAITRFNCHQNSDKVTENVTKNLNQVSKVFTKIVKVSSPVSTEKVLYKWKPYYGFLLRTSRIFRHIRKALAELANYTRSNDLQRISSSRLQVDSCIRSYTNKPIRVAMIKTVSMRNIFFINYLTGLFSFSRQVAITQAEKLVFSFFACSSICSISSWGKRISLRFDLLVSFAILIHKKLLVRTIYTKLKDKNSIDMYGQIKIYCADRFKFKTLINAIARSIRSTTSYLTTNIKDTNAMANSNNTLHPKNGQDSKLFKFYDLSTAQVVQSIAPTERQARKNLGKQSLIFIAQIRLYSLTERFINLGGYSHV